MGSTLSKTSLLSKGAGAGLARVGRDGRIRGRSVVSHGRDVSAVDSRAPTPARAYL